jgi:hypothetical protein
MDSFSLQGKLHEQSGSSVNSFLVCIGFLFSFFVISHVLPHPFAGQIVHVTTFTLSDSHNSNNQLIIYYLIDQTKA